jgi:hypothetical protein
LNTSALTPAIAISPTWSKLSLIGTGLYNIDFLGVRRPLRAPGEFGIGAGYEFAYERPFANVKASASFLIHPAYSGPMYFLIE